MGFLRSSNTTGTAHRIHKNTCLHQKYIAPTLLNQIKSHYYTCSTQVDTNPLKCTLHGKYVHAVCTICFIDLRVIVPFTQCPSTYCNVCSMRVLKSSSAYVFPLQLSVGEVSPPSEMRVAGTQYVWLFQSST